MTIRMFLSALLVIVALAPCLAIGQPDRSDPAGLDPASLRAFKYHQVLLKRPEPGYLYDRFYNTWLDESTVDQLQTFLAGRVQETSATADRLLLAFFHVKQGDDVAAIEAFHAALANDPASAATWFQKALVEARTLVLFRNRHADSGQERLDGRTHCRPGSLPDQQSGHRDSPRPWTPQGLAAPRSPQGDDASD